MLDTGKIIDGLIARGFTHICVIPCSFASDLINAAINHSGIHYLPAASEAVGCSIAAGIKMAGGKPLLIVQSSGVTNIGSCVTSLLQPYDLPLAILASWRTYAEGDSEIQHKHLAKALPELIAAYGCNCERLDSTSEQAALDQLENADRSGTLLLLEDGSFSAVELAPENALDLGGFPGRMDYLALLPALAGEDATFIGTTGNTAREMYDCIPSQRNFYMAGNMGGALSIGLGAALQGRQVIVCGGDAEFAMHLGGMATAGRYREKLGGGALIYLVFDNASNKSTGGQRSYQEHLDYAGIARSCNFAVPADSVTGLADFRRAVAAGLALAGPVFIHVMCSYDPLTPRPGAQVITDSQKAFRGKGN